MKNEDFDAFLINVVENDKKNIGYGDNFDAMCNRLTGHQKKCVVPKKDDKLCCFTNIDDGYSS